MADPQRPRYFEGQVLAAADLTAAVDYARNRAARHDRYLHDWGIAEGLALTTEPMTDPDGGSFVVVTLQPGVAVDGTGREVVVTAPVALQEALFEEVNGAEPPTGAPYPVFLAGLDRDGPAIQHTTNQSGRVDESFQILFGRLGDERLVAEQRPPAVGDGPGDGRVPWLVLLGFVGWSGGHFTAVTARARGVGPRYAGVRADTVAARAGTLTLRPQPTAGDGGTVVTLDGRTGLAFGLYRADGSVDDLLVVSPRGDLTVRGTISGGQRSGEVSAVSGVATDGMILPLPAGVTADQVSAGRVVLHTWLTPHLAGAAPRADGVWLTAPAECTVDEQRRVRCRVRSIRVDEPSASPPREDPAAADFLVLATVGGTS
jgi:hypothetical protein